MSVMTHIPSREDMSEIVRYGPGETAPAIVKTRAPRPKEAPLDFGACVGCEHEFWPGTRDAPACALIDKDWPCLLGQRILAGGPWEPGCPRNGVNLGKLELPPET